MSVEAMSIVWAMTVKPSARKLVLLALANYADEAGTCYPGQTRLAEMTGQSVRSVRDHLVALEDAEIIEREERRRDDGSRTSDRYRLNLPVVDPTGNFRVAYRQLSPTSPAKSAGQEPKEEPKEEPLLPGEAGRGVDELFERWYSLYPRKVSKGAARRAYRTAVKKVTHAELMAALSEQLGELSMQNRPEGDFRPYPATWLNGEKWADTPSSGGKPEPKRDGNGRIREW